MVKNGALVRRRRRRAVGASGVFTAARSAYNAYRSFTKTGTKRKRSYEMAPLTAEKDVRVVYRKRTMPRRKKRRYVKSLKRFKSMMMKTEPSRISQFFFGEQNTAIVNTCHYFGAFMGLAAQNYYDNAFSTVFDQFTDGGGAGAKTDASHIRIDHMGLQVVIRNNSSTAEGNPGQIDLDVYKVVCTRDIPDDLWANGVAIQSFLTTTRQKMRQHVGIDIETDTGGTGIPSVIENSDNVVGDLLFNNPPFLRYFKVLKMWKVQLGPGQITTFNWRDTGNNRIAKDACFGTSKLAARRGLTKGYIFNINGRYDPVEGISYPVDCISEVYTRYNCKPLVPHSDTLVYNGI